MPSFSRCVAVFVMGVLHGPAAAHGTRRANENPAAGGEEKRAAAKPRRARRHRSGAKKIGAPVTDPAHREKMNPQHSLYDALYAQEHRRSAMAKKKGRGNAAVPETAEAPNRGQTESGAEEAGVKQKKRRSRKRGGRGKSKHHSIGDGEEGNADLSDGEEGKPTPTFPGFDFFVPRGKATKGGKGAGGEERKEEDKTKKRSQAEQMREFAINQGVTGGEKTIVSVSKSACAPRDLQRALLVQNRVQAGPGAGARSLFYIQGQEQPAPELYQEV
jgi:hypothetical protein